jgi:enamine deaminase RidA (YjgF/YER057c/UK114 family)
MEETVLMAPPIGKFSRSRAIEVGTGKMIFLSGTATIGQAPYDIRTQTSIIFKKLGRLLLEHDAELADLVKITAFLADMREYPEYNNTRNEVFRDIDPPPASSSVEARLVYPELRVEVEGIAFVPANRRPE